MGRPRKQRDETDDDAAFLKETASLQISVTVNKDEVNQSPITSTIPKQSSYPATLDVSIPPSCKKSTEDKTPSAHHMHDYHRGLSYLL